MVFKRFRTNCVIRVSLLTATLALFFYLIFKTNLYSAVLILGISIVYQTFSLIRYVDKTNRDLARFFQAVRYDDFTQSYKQSGLGSSFDFLMAELTEITEAFRRARSEKEEHYRYLQTVVQHVGIGLIAFKDDGQVELINTAAKRLLKIPRLKNIKSLESISKTLVDTLFQMESRENALVKVEFDNELLHLALYATEFKLRGEKFTLVSLQNIHGELEEREIEAWQKIIRVLTHEIMNSITPIASLTSTINELIKEAYRKEIQAKKPKIEALGDIQQALQTIQKRSHGLLNFVDAYRNLTKIPKPHFQVFAIHELFTRVERLMQANITGAGARFEAHVEPQTLELTADPELIEQVLINLILNAVQAVNGQKDAGIKLEADLDKWGRIIIRVTDNGPGIPEENLEKIFVPFFSTKEGGSGIGLSLSRQIMRLHRGAISVHSEPNVQTVFTLVF